MARRLGSVNRPGFGFRGLGGSTGGGAPAWSPLDDEDTILWLDAGLSPMTLTGSLVDQINDLSPTGAHATATGTARPTYGATTVDGQYPALTFNGSTTRLTCAGVGAALDGATGVTAFMVIQDRSTTARYWLEWGASGGSVAGSFAVILNSGAANRPGFYVRGNVGQNVWLANADEEGFLLHKCATFSADFTAAAASEVAPIRVDSVPLNGAQTGANENTGTFLTKTLYIGASSTITLPIDGDLCALIIVKRSCSDADKLQFEEYLGGRFGLPFAANLSARPAPRILWSGQSNAEGQLEGFATIENYNETMPTPPWVYAYKDEYFSGSWSTSTWGPPTSNPGSGWEGPDLVTAIRVLRTHKMHPELIFCVRGATTLATNWNPSGPGTEWMRLSGTTLPTALSTHPAPPSSPIPWFVWIQGESDTVLSGDATAYEANLTALIAAVRALDGMTGAKVVISKLHPSCSLGTSTTRGQVIAAQDAVAAADDDVFTVETSDLTLQGDSLHYTQLSAITLGQRIADVIAANTP